jgi:SAM-dependent methyltransferase
MTTGETTPQHSRTAAAASQHPPAGALPTGSAHRVRELEHVAPELLVVEMIARMREHQMWSDSSDMMSLGAKLMWGMRDQLNVHNNRFSTVRCRDLYYVLLGCLAEQPTITEATVLDLGCGGVNPGAFLFVLLALGARRGFAVDLDHLHDERLSVRALADVAATMLIDPASIVGAVPIDPHQVLRNLASFDLAKLQRGDLAGLDSQRLAYKRESASAISLASADVDIVVSNAFLEHVDDCEATVREMARITKPGGTNIHVIDATDHRRYGYELHPLAFLTEPGPGMAHGSNRLRASEFVRLFSANGFRVTECTTLLPVDVSPAQRASFAAPYRECTQADLEAGVFRLVARRG